MPRLVIEYVLGGDTPGYNYTGATNGLSEELLKIVWRGAFPRGQGWGAYVGARALKCFALGERQYALSQVMVTPAQDEIGRRGIRRAEIDVLAEKECIDYLAARLENYPAAVQAQLSTRPSLSQWTQIIDRKLPKLRGTSQLLLASPYAGADAWQLMEALVIKLALHRFGPIKRQTALSSFTTLALEYRDEGQIVALPTQHIRGVNAPIIHVA
ncbi:MAG: hypothetical protein HXY40_07020 [Chloroflexi bacterium]|nr:hypothetical protein [Chloroflexota bacterium]